LVQLEQYTDASSKVVVAYYKITNMAHGTAVDPGICYQQGGVADNLAFDVNLYAPFWAAQFFGILQIPYNITGSDNVSINQQGLTYSVPNATNSTYTWTVPDGAIIITGQGTNSITVNWGTGSGVVSVIETLAGGCKNGPAELFVTTGSVSGIIPADDIIHFGIYPNPNNSGILQLYFDNRLSGKHWSLSDATGKKIFDRVISAPNASADITGLANGLYIVKAEGVNTTQKLIIQQ
jgi:hypothetical protein